ncbi:SDR family oxidoreductase [Halegenticoccus tardaugens]|uniref:SDR family oxidoreductase n=1 Tax=Halegenticoccus tardaugens TaxID=2071624 RepID=UPI00100B7951|nr:SDR family oxidoreductase [Halegenticoccus tardaugens]
MDLGIADDAAIVAASTSGLGKATATALAREGANVVVNGRDQEKLDTIVAELRSVGSGDIVGKQADLTDADDISDLVEAAVDEFGGLDHLITNAGGPPSGPFMEMNDEEWYDAFDLLVMSAVRLVREAASHLKEGGGTITNITSMTVKEAADGLILSNSVRMSVIGLEKTLSKEFAPDVRVNAVLPGSHETDRTRELVTQGIERGDYEDYESGLKERYDDIPLGIGDPMNLGDTVAFLCSERASNITGVALPVDGGRSHSNL